MLLHYRNGDEVMYAPPKTTQILSRLRAAFETDIELIDLFRFVTLRDLAEEVKRSGVTERSLEESVERSQARAVLMKGRLEQREKNQGKGVPYV